MPATTDPASTDQGSPAAPGPTPSRWGADFDPDRLAILELRMWKAYYRRQPARLFGYLVRGLHEQAGASWPRALAASIPLTRAAVGFSRATGDYERYAPDVARGYRLLGIPAGIDVDTVAREELRWWVVRRELGLGAGQAAEVRDRGAVADPAGPAGQGDAYWPEVARLLRRSYRSLSRALEPPGVEDPA